MPPGQRRATNQARRKKLLTNERHAPDSPETRSPTALPQRRPTCGPFATVPAGQLIPGRRTNHRVTPGIDQVLLDSCHEHRAGQAMTRPKQPIATGSPGTEKAPASRSRPIRRTHDRSVPTPTAARSPQVNHQLPAQLPTRPPQGATGLTTDRRHGLGRSGTEKRWSAPAQAAQSRTTDHQRITPSHITGFRDPIVGNEKGRDPRFRRSQPNS
jgi:hypothetical protein